MARGAAGFFGGFTSGLTTGYEAAQKGRLRELEIDKETYEKEYRDAKKGIAQPVMVTMPDGSQRADPVDVQRYQNENFKTIAQYEGYGAAEKARMEAVTNRMTMFSNSLQSGFVAEKMGDRDAAKKHFQTAFDMSASGKGGAIDYDENGQLVMRRRNEDDTYADPEPVGGARLKAAIAMAKDPALYFQVENNRSMAEYRKDVMQFDKDKFERSFQQRVREHGDDKALGWAKHEFDARQTHLENQMAWARIDQNDDKFDQAKKEHNDLMSYRGEILKDSDEDRAFKAQQFEETKENNAARLGLARNNYDEDIRQFDANMKRHEGLDNQRKQEFDERVRMNDETVRINDMDAEWKRAKAEGETKERWDANTKAADERLDEVVARYTNPEELGAMLANPNLSPEAKKNIEDMSKSLGTIREQVWLRNTVAGIMAENRHVSPTEAVTAALEARYFRDAVRDPGGSPDGSDFTWNTRSSRGELIRLPRTSWGVFEHGYQQQVEEQQRRRLAEQQKLDQQPGGYSSTPRPGDEVPKEKALPLPGRGGGEKPVGSGRGATAPTAAPAGVGGRGSAQVGVQEGPRQAISTRVGGTSEGRTAADELRAMGGQKYGGQKYGGQKYGRQAIPTR